MGLRRFDNNRNTNPLQSFKDSENVLTVLAQVSRASDLRLQLLRGWLRPTIRKVAVLNRAIRLRDGLRPACFIDLTKLIDQSIWVVDFKHGLSISTSVLQCLFSCSA